MSPKLALLLIATPLFSQTGAIEKAVLEVNAQMTRAAEARDIDRLFTFMLPNDRGSIAQSGFLFLTREDAHDTVKRGFTAVQKIAYRWKHQLVTVLSPDTALLVADGESEATFADGAAAVTPFAQTVVFVRRDGEWKALHAHQSSSPRR
jgi:ketosteroid isomerase-like protein